MHHDNIHVNVIIVCRNKDFRLKWAEMIPYLFEENKSILYYLKGYMIESCVRSKRL